MKQMTSILFREGPSEKGWGGGVGEWDFPEFLEFISCELAVQTFFVVYQPFLCHKKLLKFFSLEFCLPIYFFACGPPHPAPHPPLSLF